MTRTTEPGARRTVYEAQRRPRAAARPAVHRRRRRASPTVESRPDGSQTATYPDGAQVETRARPGPAVGLLRPGARRRCASTTPGGLHARRTAHARRRRSPTRAIRSASRRSPTTAVTNGRTTTTSSFDRADADAGRTTTPAGRERTACVDAQGRLTRAERGPGLAARSRSPATLAGASTTVQRGRRTRGRSSTTRANRLLARVDAEGRRTEFARDAVGRATLLHDARAAASYGFGYDAAGNRDDGRRCPTAAEHVLGVRRRRPARSASRPPARRAVAARSTATQDGALERRHAPERAHDRLRPRRRRPAHRPDLRAATRRASPTRATRPARARSTGRRRRRRHRPAARLHVGRRPAHRASPPPGSRQGATTTPTTPTCACRARS